MRIAMPICGECAGQTTGRNYQPIGRSQLACVIMLDRGLALSAARKPYTRRAGLIDGKIGAGLGRKYQ